VLGERHVGGRVAAGRRRAGEQQRRIEDGQQVGDAAPEDGDIDGER
jgi:hypothetical protein